MHNCVTDTPSNQQQVVHTDQQQPLQPNQPEIFDPDPMQSPSVNDAEIVQSFQFSASMYFIVKLFLLEELFLLRSKFLER
jgi:hypothetical protein